MNFAETNSQSDLSWKKRKRCDSTDEILDIFPSTSSTQSLQQPNQQHHQQQQHKHARKSLTQPQQLQQLHRPFYVMLAKESPRRQLNSDDEGDSESAYDSFNGRETDFCRDTSDTDYSTDGIATLEVLEYGVASTSTSEDLYTHDSSSGTGTDEFVIAAAELARAMFKNGNAIGGGGGIGKRSDGGTSGTESIDDGLRRYIIKDQLELLADIEESDTPTDPELGRADYWKCVKCKNRQNNPMYRYCEKCYQIRKTHFPPRPTLRKTRSCMFSKFQQRTPPTTPRSCFKTNSIIPIAASAGSSPSTSSSVLSSSTTMLSSSSSSSSSSDDERDDGLYIHPRTKKNYNNRRHHGSSNVVVDDDVGGGGGGGGGGSDGAGDNDNFSLSNKNRHYRPYSRHQRKNHLLLSPTALSTSPMSTIATTTTTTTAAGATTTMTTKNNKNCMLNQHLHHRDGNNGNKLLGTYLNDNNKLTKLNECRIQASSSIITTATSSTSSSSSSLLLSSSSTLINTNNNKQLLQQSAQQQQQLQHSQLQHHKQQNSNTHRNNSNHNNNLNNQNSAGESSAASDENNFEDCSRPSSYSWLGDDNLLINNQINSCKGVDNNCLSKQLTNKLFKNGMGKNNNGNCNRSDKIQPPNHLNIRKDSGFSSSYSSQELSPDVLPESQETFCSELEEMIHHKKSFQQNKTHTTDGITTTTTAVTTMDIVNNGNSTVTSNILPSSSSSSVLAPQQSLTNDICQETQKGSLVISLSQASTVSALSNYDDDVYQTMILSSNNTKSFDQKLLNNFDEKKSKLRSTNSVKRTYSDLDNDDDVGDVETKSDIEIISNNCTSLKKSKTIDLSTVVTTNRSNNTNNNLLLNENSQNTTSSVAVSNNQSVGGVDGGAAAGMAGFSSEDMYGSCIICLTKPKNGVFVHSRYLHLCCCYGCAVKIWNKRKRCPICNGRVKNVMKLFVH